MRTLCIATLACLAFCYALYEAADVGATRVEQAQALHCARASDGTDQSIADCYTSRNLPVPGDL